MLRENSRKNRNLLVQISTLMWSFIVWYEKKFQEEVFQTSDLKCLRWTATQLWSKLSSNWTDFRLYRPYILGTAISTMALSGKCCVWNIPPKFRPHILISSPGVAIVAFISVHSGIIGGYNIARYTDIFISSFPKWCTILVHRTSNNMSRTFQLV